MTSIRRRSSVGICGTNKSCVTKVDKDRRATKSINRKSLAHILESPAVRQNPAKHEHFRNEKIGENHEPETSLTDKENDQEQNRKVMFRSPPRPSQESLNGIWRDVPQIPKPRGTPKPFQNNRNKGDIQDSRKSLTPRQFLQANNTPKHEYQRKSPPVLSKSTPVYSPSKKRSLTAAENGQFGSLSPIKAVTPTKASPAAAASQINQKEETSPEARGFDNLGNTCYMNASIQALFCLTDFMKSLRQIDIFLKRSEIMTSEFLQRVPLFSALNRLLVARNKLVSSEMLRRRLARIRAVIQRKAVQFAGDDQQDAYEWMNQVIDQINDEFKLILADEQLQLILSKPQLIVEKLELKPAVVESTMELLKSNLVETTFQSTLCHVIVCQNCGKVTQSKESALNLTIQLPSSTADEPYTVQDLIDLHNSPEEIEFHCPNCSDDRAIITHQFETLPKILIVNVKRYRYDPGSGEGIKNDDPIVIPQFITLHHYTSKYQPDDNEKISKCSVSEDKSPTKETEIDVTNGDEKYPSGTKLNESTKTNDSSDSMLQPLISSLYREIDGSDDEKEESKEIMRSDNKTEHEENGRKQIQNKSSFMEIGSLLEQSTANNTNGNASSESMEIGSLLDSSNKKDTENNSLTESMTEIQPLFTSMNDDGETDKRKSASSSVCDETPIRRPPKRAKLMQIVSDDDDSIVKDDMKPTTSTTNEVPNPDPTGTEEFMILDEPSEEDGDVVERRRSLQAMPLRNKLNENLQTGAMPHSYALSSVVSHLGWSSTLRSGHYICDGKQDMSGGEWRTYDDKVTELTTLSNVQKDRQRYGYVFIYTAHNNSITDTP